jgi:hypothetical protein
MLLWINGPFGGGKTHTAHELQRRLPGSVICDPEEVGFGLHRMTPPHLRHDFQDYPSWRQVVFEVLHTARTEQTGVVIVPMTVVHPLYFDETVGRLRRCGHDVRHFAWLAERQTVRNRLQERALGRALQAVVGQGVPLRRESFAVAQLDLCLERLSGPKFADQVWTDHIGVPDVADRIAASAGLTLAPNMDSEWRGRLRRAWTGARHIQLG